MPKIAYTAKRFSDKSLAIIYQAVEILEEYEALGYDLTLRQLYYQFVARDIIPNRQSEYNRLGSIVNDARLAGLIDWDHIVDRTRNLRALAHWNNPDAIIRSAAQSFAIDKWKTQPYYIEVWIEKDALVGVIERVANTLDLPYFSCRGYTSQSEMWGAAQRLGHKLAAGKEIRILHLGDHDPSGIDMTRDIEERLLLFIATDYFHAQTVEYEGEDDFDDTGMFAVDWAKDRFEIDRLALNMDQVLRYSPPPNPAKITDSRAGGYIAKHGGQSWELDALPPDVLSRLVEDQVRGYLDHDAWQAAVEEEAEHTKLLDACSAHWSEVAGFLTDLTEES